MSISKYYIPFVFLTLLSCGEFEEKSSSMDDTPEVSVDQNQNINIEMIATSEIRTSCIVLEKDCNEAVKALHSYFELDK